MPPESDLGGHDMPLIHGPFTFDAVNDADCQEFTFTSGGNGQTVAGQISNPGVAADFCHDTNGGNSANVGPDFGQGGNPDGYLYTETSSPGASGDQYTMTFDTVLDASVYQWQFNFYTCQRGPAAGNNDSTCVVQINENGAGWVTVASFGGSGDDTTTTVWVSRSVDLSESGANADSSTQVRILITSASETSWHADYGIDTVEIVGTELAAPIDQSGYGFYDDGTESGSTIDGSEDSGITESTSVTKQLRVQLDASGDPASRQYGLQVRKVGDANSEWRDV